jgi:hypothetical protein
MRPLMLSLACLALLAGGLPAQDVHGAPRSPWCDYRLGTLHRALDSARRVVADSDMASAHSLFLWFSPFRRVRSQLV